MVTVMCDAIGVRLNDVNQWSDTKLKPMPRENRVNNILINYYAVSTFFIWHGNSYDG